MEGTWAGDRWERSGPLTFLAFRRCLRAWFTPSLAYRVRRGLGAVLRADPRGAGASAAAVRCFRACACSVAAYAAPAAPTDPHPARRPALPGAAWQPQHPPPEPCSVPCSWRTTWR